MKAVPFSLYFKVSFEEFLGIKDYIYFFFNLKNIIKISILLGSNSSFENAVYKKCG